MAEQSPAPTPSRSIYGFVVYLLFSTLFVLYVLWSFIPLEFFENYLGIITEGIPNKYFALFLPILLLTATTLFAFCIYPSFSFIMTPDIDSINTITDSSAIRRCQFRNANGVLCDNKIPKGTVHSWATSYECDNHQNRESKVANYCDCTDKTKCMLTIDEEFIEKLRKQVNQRNSADLDIREVSEILYGDSNKLNIDNIVNES